ncbi:MAG: hypothetical protein JJD96_06810 [Thermoleophilia bacterium]|nr:hypothetical protein [Thermoleophilia bacterium]
MRVRVRKLVWDDWNISHIARRQITPEDIDWLLIGMHPRPRFDRGRSGTLAAWGKDERDRYLLLILAERSPGVFYPVTARPMTTCEKSRFKELSK